MSAWGLAGGGPMNAQQIETLIAYLKTIQIPREDCPTEEATTRCATSGHLPAEDQEDDRDAARQSVEDGTYAQLRRGAVQPRPGERRVQLRPLPHRGWSYGDPGVPGRAPSGGTSPVARENTHFPNERGP